MFPTLVPAVLVYAGDTITFPTYTITDSAGTPVDLSAWTWRAQWRYVATADVAVELDVDDSQAADGIIKISADSTDSRAMGRDGVWDLQGTQGSTVQTWIYGPTEWVEDVTR